MAEVFMLGRMAEVFMLGRMAVVFMLGWTVVDTFMLGRRMLEQIVRASFGPGNLENAT
jgi:hypothetical protein